MKLNVASGLRPKEEYINIDSDPRVHPDIVRNIEQGLPFSDNTVEEISSEHTLEHINPDNIHFVMFEFWRVLKQGGRLKVVVPIGKGWSNSPEHKCPFDYRSYLFFTDWNLREPYKFKLIKREVTGLDITEELHFELEAIK